jgi:hypothetical protein
MANESTAMPDLLALEKAGAAARAARLDELSCYLYRDESMPAATGESLALWVEKLDAWTRGWKIEDAIRGR